MCCKNRIANLNFADSKGLFSFYGQLLYSPKKLTQISNAMVVSRELFLKRDFLSLLQFAYATDKAELLETFKKAGIEIEKEEDLKSLADLYNTGKDKSGALKDKNGNPLILDLMAVFAQIQTTEEEVYKALQERRLIFI